MSRHINKSIAFTHYELLELIAVVRATKDAAVQQHNKAEARLMTELNQQLLNYHIDACGTVVLLDNVSRYVLWSIMERYASFCSDTHQLMEYALVVTIMEKLQK